MADNVQVYDGDGVDPAEKLPPMVEVTAQVPSTKTKMVTPGFYVREIDVSHVVPPTDTPVRLF